MPYKAFFELYLKLEIPSNSLFLSLQCKEAYFDSKTEALHRVGFPVMYYHNPP
jgi:hypothetical protein